VVVVLVVVVVEEQGRSVGWRRQRRTNFVGFSPNAVASLTTVFCPTGTTRVSSWQAISPQTLRAKVQRPSQAWSTSHWRGWHPTTQSRRTSTPSKQPRLTVRAGALGPPRAARPRRPWAGAPESSFRPSFQSARVRTTLRTLIEAVARSTSDRKPIRPVIPRGRGRCARPAASAGCSPSRWRSTTWYGCGHSGRWLHEEAWKTVAAVGGTPPAKGPSRTPGLIRGPLNASRGDSLVFTARFSASC